MVSTAQLALSRQGTSVRATVARILAAWDRATDTNREEGARWYLIANQAATDLAVTYGTTVEHAAAVIAHLSPRTPWARNLTGAASVFAGRPIPGLLGRNLEGARRAMAAAAPLATLTGPKTRAFAANIVGDDTAVTVDVWALRVALGPREDEALVLNRAGVYEAVAHCYRLAAARRGVTPATMQATTWIVARGGRAD